MASIYRALAEYEKQQRHPEAVEAAHTDFAALQGDDIPRPRPSLAAVEGPSPVETS